MVAAMSAFSQWRSKEESTGFRPQPVIRDFCFGAFLTAILYMFLPESFETLISKGTSVAAGAVEKATKQLGGGSSGGSPASSGFADIELQTGPARF